MSHKVTKKGYNWFFFFIFQVFIKWWPWTGLQFGHLQGFVSDFPSNLVSRLPFSSGASASLFFPLGDLLNWAPSSLLSIFEETSILLCVGVGWLFPYGDLTGAVLASRREASRQGYIGIVSYVA